AETQDLSTEEPERFEALKAALSQWESTTVAPWWNESAPWQQVTIDIHKDLMANQPVHRVSPE
ncbi:hypothetical protein RZS08_13705, partial [Arthrospira platensis SPKY1]|nr:hypothetical protein [Arthrospira platensis SPKY1]